MPQIGPVPGGLRLIGNDSAWVNSVRKSTFIQA
jgi:hypothetical protein